MDDNQLSFSSDQEKLNIGEFSFKQHKLCLQLESTLYSSLAFGGIPRHTKANGYIIVPATGSQEEGECLTQIQNWIKQSYNFTNETQPNCHVT